jgi:endonuclease YncB( thermonuclease family)
MAGRLAHLVSATVVMLVPLLWSKSGMAEQITGRASIIDGDTLEIHGTRIRLWGIDAPEATQLCRGDDSLQYRCGAKAANALDAFLGGPWRECWTQQPPFCSGRTVVEPTGPILQ